MLYELLLLFAALFALLYWYITKNFDHWEKLGVPHRKPTFPFGSAANVVMRYKHDHENNLEVYKEWGHHKLVGSYLFGKPVLVVNDPDLLRAIFVKDFDVFSDRNPKFLDDTFFITEQDQIWAKQMTALRGQDWKDLRSAVSPIFTSGKLKVMMKLIHEVGKKVEDELDDFARNNEELELKQLYGKFTMDSLASCVFGFDTESFFNPNSQFIKNASRLMRAEARDVLTALLALIPGMSYVLKKLNISLMKPEATSFFIDIVKKTLQQRRVSKIRRNDMIDMMLDIMKGNVTENEDVHGHEQFEIDSKIIGAKDTKVINDDHLIGTAMVFLAAGYDTTSILLSWVGYELAVNPEIQDRLQQEVDDAFEDSDGKFPDYSTIQGLPYLDQVVHETLRFHPPISTNTRTASRPYTLPGTDVTLKENDMIIINMSGIQRDKRYYKNADNFDPEHFSKEAKAERNPYTFLAFGQGPRNCIGMRFALLEAKVALVSTMRKFRLVRSPKSDLDKKYDTSGQMGYPKLGLWVRVQKRV